jgi:hypothetical protein
MTPLKLSEFDFDVPGLFKVICAWCKAERGYKRSYGDSTGISHTICQECLENMKE